MMRATINTLLADLSEPAPPRPDPEAAYAAMVREAELGRLPTAEHARDVLERARRSPRQFKADVATIAADFTLAALRQRAHQLAGSEAHRRHAFQLRSVPQRLELAAKLFAADHQPANATRDDLARLLANWPSVEADNAVDDFAERLRTFAGTLTGSTPALDCRSVVLSAAAHVEVALGAGTIAETTAAELLRA
jgi:hypothetical protein